MSNQIKQMTKAILMLSPGDRFNIADEIDSKTYSNLCKAESSERAFNRGVVSLIVERWESNPEYFKQHYGLIVGSAENTTNIERSRG